MSAVTPTGNDGRRLPSGERARPPSIGSPARAAVRLLAYFLFTAAAIPVQWLLLRLGGDACARFPRWYHRVCAHLMGMRVRIVGAMSDARPTLFACNHSSYLDITLLGGVLLGSFVAKAEVADWPFYGLLAKLQRTVFVDRRRHTTHLQRDDLSRRLAAGDNLILFPEGTSNDGNRLLPFRSALFSVAERPAEARQPPLVIQPVSIAYVRLNGLPIGYGLRPCFAWYGDMELFSHLWRLVGLGGIEVVVEFHPPVTLAQFPSRKQLSDHCHRAIAKGIDAALFGRVEALGGAGRRGVQPASESAKLTGG